MIANKLTLNASKSNLLIQGRYRRGGRRWGRIPPPPQTNAQNFRGVKGIDIRIKDNLRAWWPFFCSLLDLGRKNGHLRTSWLFFCSSLDFGQKMDGFKLRPPSIPRHAPVGLIINSKLNSFVDLNICSKTGIGLIKSLQSFKYLGVHIDIIN